ncbi:MAG: hypothetical protein AAF215_06345 [Cyanobacteria bacterium P01_A01_bin.123]
MAAFRKLIIIFATSIPLFIGVVQPTQGQNISFSALPNGEYYYLGTPASEFLDSPYILLHKWGRIVIGIDARLPTRLVCFKGFVEDDRIVDATSVLPPYTPGSAWDYQSGEMLDLSQYDRITYAGTEEDRATLDICLDVFSR